MGRDTNSQEYGMDLIILCFGNSLTKLCFKTFDPNDGALQNSNLYEFDPTFSYEMEGGHIVILDAISDLIMIHKLVFLE